MLPNIHIARDMLMKAGTGLKPRRIRDYELLYFPNGTGSVYMVEGRTYSLNEPCFIITRPGEWHEYRYDSAQQSRHLFVHFGYNGREYVKEDDLLPILRHDGPSCLPLKKKKQTNHKTQLMN